MFLVQQLPTLLS